jgi:hypothetical protein
MKRATRTVSGAELHELRVVMAQRGLDSVELARLAGVHPRTLQNTLAGNNPFWPVRAAINRALRQRVFDAAYHPRRRRAASGQKIAGQAMAAPAGDSRTATAAQVLQHQVK